MSTPRMGGDIRLVFGYDGRVGYSRREESREVAADIEAANQRIKGVTLGQLSTGGLVTLEVRCLQCSRRGGYNLGRLISANSASMLLSSMVLARRRRWCLVSGPAAGCLGVRRVSAETLSSNCPNRMSHAYLRKCGVYFPDIDRHCELANAAKIGSWSSKSTSSGMACPN